MTENQAVISQEKHYQHGNVVSYIVGFVLSVILTVIAFYIVISHSLSLMATGIALGILATLQIIVQSSLFLHVSLMPSKRVDLISFLFSVFVALVIVFGTLFVMHNVGHFMMSR